MVAHRAARPAGEGPPATALQEEERLAAAMVHSFEAVDREIMTRCRLEGTKGGATGLVVLRIGENCLGSQAAGGHQGRGHRAGGAADRCEAVGSQAVQYLYVCVCTLILWIGLCGLMGLCSCPELPARSSWRRFHPQILHASSKHCGTRRSAHRQRCFRRSTACPLALLQATSCTLRTAGTRAR